jgi:hypothetical protein
VLGSIFYGVILGIFLVAFYLKRISGKAVFISGLIVQSYIILSVSWPWFTSKLPVLELLPKFVTAIMMSASTIGFLWLNCIGAIGVILLSMIFQPFVKRRRVTG